MKKVLVALLLFSCGKQPALLEDTTTPADPQSSEAFITLEQLPLLKTPLTFNSHAALSSPESITMDTALLQRIAKIIPNQNLLGKIYQTEDFIGLLTVAPADIATPVLTTYDKNGKEIDSFFLYPTAGGDIGFYSTNVVTLHEDKQIILIDSTLARKLNQEGTDEIPGTDSLRVTQKKYRINAKGKIEEVN